MMAATAAATVCADAPSKICVLSAAVENEETDAFAISSGGLSPLGYRPCQRPSKDGALTGTKSVDFLLAKASALP